MRILIAGAGIGGLSTALCCLALGHQVTILEQSPRLSEIGAGIQLPPNAMRVFDKLGLAGKLQQYSAKPAALTARMGISGRRLFRIPLEQGNAPRWHAPYLHIHRADYIQVLFNAVTQHTDAKLELATCVSSYKNLANGVSVSCTNARKYDADVLVAADGIHSNIRKQMHGRSNPHFSGNIAWRAVAPVEMLGANVPENNACVWMGKGRHAVTYRLRCGELANFVGVVERNTRQTESWSTQGERSEALEDFRGWHSCVTSILENAPQLHRWGLFDRAPLTGWTNQRVALLGDAAHPMLPFMAQGAAMAVEDAWQLAASLNTYPDSPAEALQCYAASRRQRCSKAQRQSSRNARIFHRKNAMSQTLQYLPLWIGGKLAPSLLARQFDWLYSYDITNNNA
ncbi:MAG: monooxygenase [Pseudomonadales bacterium]|nr:monooxygenase [Pseudomonadales bacterium]